MLVVGVRTSTWEFFGDAIQPIGDFGPNHWLPARGWRMVVCQPEGPLGTIELHTLIFQVGRDSPVSQG